MTPGSQTAPPVLTRAALAGLAAGAAVSSLFGVRIFAGFVAVALAAGVVLAFNALVEAGRIFSALGGLLAMLFPLAVAERGEGGIMLAGAASLMVLAAGYVVRGQRPPSLEGLAAGLAIVLHLGLLGSYLVLIAAAGNRLLPALVLMAAAFEMVYGVLAGRGSPASRLRQKPGQKHRRGRVIPAGQRWIDIKAAIGGVLACQLAALGARFFLPSPPGVGSSVLLGGVVGAGAILGHAGAVAVSNDLRSRLRGRSGVLDSAVFPHLNALLFAAGAFHYGFRLYLV